MTICLGVDPGLNGAIAATCSTRGLLEHANLPTCSNGAGPKTVIKRKVDGIELRKLVQAWSVRHAFAQDHVRAVIERMQPFTRGDSGSPPTTLISMGHSAGIIEGILIPFCHERPLQALPQQWKKAFGLTRNKAGAVDAVRRLFPHIGRIRHDVAEAILISSWGLGEISMAPTEPEPEAEEDDVVEWTDPFAPTGATRPTEDPFADLLQFRGP